MRIHDILEGKSENRELWDKIRSKGVVPNIDREKYQARDGLEGPFRLRNGKVVYYDPQEGSYYDPDTDMYISYDDYKKMDEAEEAGSAQIADLIRKKNSASSPIARKNIDSQIAQLKRQRDKTNEEDAYDRDVKSSNKPHDKEAAAKRAKAAALAAAKKAKEQDVAEANNDTGVKWFDFATWALKQGDKYKDATTNHIVYKAAQKAYKAYVKSKQQGVAEGDKRPKYVVTTKDKPKIVKPCMGGESPHPYQGKLVGATEAEVGNTDYEFTHGKKPSGHGSWFFVAHRGGIDFGKDIEGEDYIQLNQMSYGDAKKAAIKWAKSKGHPSLFVAT